MIDTAWVELKRLNEDITDADKHSRELKRYVHQTAGVQATLSMSLKGGGETRPWRSLSKMFKSISVSHEVLRQQLRERRKEHYINRIDIDLVREVSDFLQPANQIVDKMESANSATLHHVLPSYYTFYRAWQFQNGDSSVLVELKREFFEALEKFWSSIGMLHHIATFCVHRMLASNLFWTKVTGQVSYYKLKNL